MKKLKFISITLVGALLVLNACKKDNGKEPVPTPTDKVTDVCGNTYPVTKIGTQYWMAENLIQMKIMERMITLTKTCSIG